MNNKSVYIGSNPDLIKDKEYTVKGLKRVCFSGPKNSGVYYLVEDNNEKDIYVHSREFIGGVCLLSDADKLISDKRIELLKQRLRERGFNPYTK